MKGAITPAAATLTVKGRKGEVTLCQCLRCGNIWKPHRPDPAKCPACYTPLWNVERAYQRAGEEAPTRKAKPRGRPFEAGFDARREGRDGSDTKDESEPSAVK